MPFRRTTNWRLLSRSRAVRPQGWSRSTLVDTWEQKPRDIITDHHCSETARAINPRIHKVDNEALLIREVLPYIADVWYESDSLETGYETGLTRYFHKPQATRRLE